MDGQLELSLFCDVKPWGSTGLGPLPHFANTVRVRESLSFLPKGRTDILVSLLPGP